MTTPANEYSFMPSASPDDVQTAEILVFTGAGRVLTVASAKDGVRSLPSAKKTVDNTLIDQACGLGSSLGLHITKLAPIYGLQKSGTYRVTFLVQATDGNITGMPSVMANGDKIVHTDIWTLCNGNEYYRNMFSTILSYIFPTVTTG